ncbi:gamma-aminobutyric acid receptor subunit rho-1-like isoform X2 [Hydractinia symbiolongicarpus]|uniref:gamma-aminobutyric acid receptor subunit rho-1-like isoform X2 n=1 Tax=Hydractinia symbiolongicarpus TaxID=13093 RepID=UPI0025503C94|nr:gamma-aminobutyric acid receptor subunit rho-1-like isoform X2 [Hydractinia symbiolongicarpus]
MMYLVVCCLLILFKFSHGSFETRLEAIKYEKSQRPFYGTGNVNVTVQIFVYLIGPINEVDFTFEIGFYLRQWWVDPRLAFNNTSEIFHATTLDHLIWIPDTSVYHSREVRIFENAVRAIIKPSGAVYYSRRLTSKIHCHMDLTFYPMDTQECHLTFENYAFTTNQVNISWHKIPIVRSTMLELNGYSLMGISSNTILKPSLVGNKTTYFKLLQSRYTVKRSYMNHIYRTFIPSSLLLIFAFGSFWVPDTAVPARMGMIVTSFLSTSF